MAIEITMRTMKFLVFFIVMIVSISVVIIYLSDGFNTAIEQHTQIPKQDLTDIPEIEPEPEPIIEWKDDAIVATPDPNTVDITQYSNLKCGPFVILVHRLDDNLNTIQTDKFTYKMSKCIDKKTSIQCELQADGSWAYTNVKECSMYCRDDTPNPSWIYETIPGSEQNIAEFEDTSVFSYVSYAMCDENERGIIQ